MIELLVRLAISMAVVMAVMGLAARFVRRRQEAGLGGGGFSARRSGRGFGRTVSGGTGTTARSGPGAAGLGAGGPGTGGAGGLAGPGKMATKLLGSLLGAPKPRRARPAAPFDIVYRRALSKGSAVAVIEATGKQFLLGITEHSITLLTELPSAPTQRDAEAAPAAPGAVATPPPAAADPPDPATPGRRADGAQVSDLEIWDEFDDWQQADRMPASSSDATTLERQNAWKLTLDSLRERTIRR